MRNIVEPDTKVFARNMDPGNATFNLQSTIQNPQLARRGCLIQKGQKALPTSRFQYREEVLAELVRHGLHPTEKTPPETVREVLVTLYLYEIRRLRDRLKRGEFPKSEYAQRVDALRRRYPVLGIPVQAWALSSQG